MARHGLEASIVAIAGSEKRLHRRHKAGARAVACVVESLEKRLFLSAGTTYVVNSLADNLPNDGSTITLREAIQAANTNKAVGDAPGPCAGQQRGQRGGCATDSARCARSQAVVAEGMDGRLHGGLARRSLRQNGGGHGSLRSATERDFSAD